MLVKLRQTVISERTIEVASLADAELIRADEERDERDWYGPTGERVTVEIVPIFKPGDRVRFHTWVHNGMRLRWAEWKYGVISGLKPVMDLAIVDWQNGPYLVPHDVPLDCLEMVALGKEPE